MHIIKNFYETVIKHDLINKFTYKKLEQLPKIKKIILNYTNKNFNFKDLAIAILALELITKHKAKLTMTKIIPTKIQNDYPINYNIVLSKTSLNELLFKLLSEILTKIKNSKNNDNNIISIKENQYNKISIKLIQPFMFNELEKHHNLFKNLPSLNITFIIHNTKIHNKELLFLLMSHKLPVFVIHNNNS